MNKQNAWLIKKPTKEQANAMFFVSYRSRPWLGKKRQASFDRMLANHWVTLLADIDVKSIPEDVKIYCRRISQYGNEYILYTEKSE